MAGQGRTVVVATHDERLLPLADRVVDLAPAVLESVGATTVSLGRGEVLFAEHSRSQQVYVVERGRIELVRARTDGTEELLRVVRPGEYFGELGPMFRLPRSATARAKTSATVSGLSVAEFRRRSACYRQRVSS
jgi:putative ABC transport system ATP-binding protein